MKLVALLAFLIAPLASAADMHHSRITFGDSVTRLVAAGVIDPQKASPALQALMARPAGEPIVLHRENAHLYVTLLWPVGLANRMASNASSPLSGPDLPGYASTGGWTLGREPNGAAYFNRVSVVELTPGEEALVVKIARHAYRPCCNNSTFYQDCNHGSALLGLLALGASQGLSEEDLLREALAFNTLWFADHYAQTALYFSTARNTQWRDVDPREVLSARLSSANGWALNVAAELRRRGLAPQPGDASCAV